MKTGLSAAAHVRPLSQSGRRSPSGAIVLLSIGMSNALIEFGAFQQLAATDPARNRHLILVNGAKGGVDAEQMIRHSDSYFAYVNQKLAASRTTSAQVQVIWLKEAIAAEHEPFPADARHLRRDLQAILALLKRHFPNLRLVYISSRIYAGYATSLLNPEPYAYDSGFAVKWTIASRVRQRHARPWVGWGPYLWADGTRGRRDGLKWLCSDFGSDGTHPSAQGARKVASRLLRFFEQNGTTRSWFNARKRR